MAGKTTSLKLSPTQIRAIASETATEIIDENKKKQAEFANSSTAQKLLQELENTPLYKQVQAAEAERLRLKEVDKELSAFLLANGKTYVSSSWIFGANSAEEVLGYMRSTYLNRHNPYMIYDRSWLEQKLYNQMTIATIDSDPKAVEEALKKIKDEFIPKVSV